MKWTLICPHISNQPKISKIHTSNIANRQKLTEVLHTAKQLDFYGQTQMLKWKQTRNPNRRFQETLRGYIETQIEKTKAQIKF